MSIRFPVAPGTVLLCDYSSGFRPPEMVKRRPPVVISPRLPHRDGPCTVVLLSGSPPPETVAYQCPVTFPEPLPAPFATVGLNRLDLFPTRRHPNTGERAFLKIRVTKGQLAAIRLAVLHALAIARLIARAA